MKELHDAILNGLYDPNYPGHELLGPKLLANHGKQRIWLSLRQELLTCQSFTWAVAFITQDMLVPFKLVMADLAKRGITGTIITGDYLSFNNPRVFRELQKIPNLEVRIVQKSGFHAKGYLFEHNDFETIIIGSANFTRSALLSNYEWSLKISSMTQADLANQLGQQLRDLKTTSEPLTTKWIEDYEASWQPPVSSTRTNSSQKIMPNRMQQAALKNLNALVAEGAQKALVVSATGTGKTYLGAFAVRDFQPKRFLYVVHRQQIAKKALASFSEVIGGPSSDYGLLSGQKHDLTAKYIFATVQTLTQEAILAELPSDYFSYILIDEAHRAAAPSYQKIFAHFNPDFYLGMTATPERMDDQNVYRLFDYHLAYEIRLRDALEEQMLTPFHYVGIQDYEVDGQVIDETTDLRYLTTPQRVAYLLKELNYYGYSGSQAKGLIFCSRQEEAHDLATAFSKHGHPAAALTNIDSQTRRENVVKALQAGKLEYIVTVDLFNEGIDIPEVNQIVFLRNTQSSIVFTQQLGRGLRKFPGKDYVTVIDFIGNYKNNYLIPLALNGDVSRDQDQARTETKIPPVIALSTINFSQIATEKILASLDKVKLDSMKELRQSYQELKGKLGRMPLLYDFYQFGSTSPELFSKNNTFKNYGDFLLKMGEELHLSSYSAQVLDFVTQELLNGKRNHELVLLKLLLKTNNASQNDFQVALKQNGSYINEAVLNSVDTILSLAFFDIKAGKTTRKMQYGGVPLIEHDLLGYQFGAKLREVLADEPDFKMLFRDAIKTGLAISQNYDQQAQFTLYQQYDREDVCRLLNWPLDVSAPMYGYRVGDQETPIFITYKKESEEKRNAIYHNQLVDGRSLRWYTRSPRHLDSDEVVRLLAPGMKLHVFLKQSDKVGKAFYYLGEAQILPDSVKEEALGPKKKAAVGMDLLLKTPLDSSMYDLLFD